MPSFSPGLLSLVDCGGCFIFQMNGIVSQKMTGTFKTPCSACRGL